MKRLLSTQNITSLGILLIILAVGAYLFFTGDPLPKLTKEESKFVPLIDIQLETMDGGAIYRLEESREETVDGRTAVFVDAYAPYDITQESLIATTKNALIELYEQHDPDRVRWFEIRMFLEGEGAFDRFVAARGVLNADQRGFNGRRYEHPWHLEIRLIPKADRLAQGIDDLKLGRILSVAKVVEQTRVSLQEALGREPDPGELLEAAATQTNIRKKMLDDLLATHEKLYGDSKILEWDLK